MQKKRRGLVKPPVVKNQPTVDQITGQKIPKSFVFSRGRLPGPVKQLELDLRKLMLPHTALKLKVFYNLILFIGVLFDMIYLDCEIYTHL